MQETRMDCSYAGIKKEREEMKDWYWKEEKHSRRKERKIVSIKGKKKKNWTVGMLKGGKKRETSIGRKEKLKGK